MEELVKSPILEEAEYKEWVHRKIDEAKKQLPAILKTLGDTEGPPEAALLDYLPESILNQLLDGLGLVVFVADEDRKKYGEVIYEDRDVLITREQYKKESDPIDIAIDKIWGANLRSLDVPAELPLPERAGVSATEILDSEKDGDSDDQVWPEYIYTAWVRIN